MINLSKDWTGEDVRRLCQEHNITQKQLAEILGVRVATVSDWARGTTKPSRLASVALTYLDLDLRNKLSSSA